MQPHILDWVKYVLLIVLVVFLVMAYLFIFGLITFPQPETEPPNIPYWTPVEWTPTAIPATPNPTP